MRKVTIVREKVKHRDKFNFAFPRHVWKVGADDRDSISSCVAV